MKLDILAIAAHPDDVELSIAGTLIRSINQGKSVGILDLTRGEMGTRGTPEKRAEEARKASALMGVEIRENALLPDGFLANRKEQQMEIIPFIRKYRPKVVIANAEHDRHPDHGMAAKLTAKACFLSGLRALATKDENGRLQEAWRPEAVYHMIQDYYTTPDFVMDISDFWPDKLNAIRAFSSQFHTGGKDSEPQTPISTPEFIRFLEARAREFGRLIGKEFGEGFTVARPPGISDLDALF